MKLSPTASDLLREAANTIIRASELALKLEAWHPQGLDMEAHRTALEGEIAFSLKLIHAATGVETP